MCFPVSGSYCERVTLPLPWHLVHVTLQSPPHLGHVSLWSVCGQRIVFLPPLNRVGGEIGYSQSFGIGPYSSVSIYQSLQRIQLRYHSIYVCSVIVIGWALLREDIPRADIATPHFILIVIYDECLTIVISISFIALFGQQQLLLLNRRASAARTSSVVTEPIEQDCSSSADSTYQILT